MSIGFSLILQYIVIFCNFKRGGNDLVYKNVVDYCNNNNITISTFEKMCGIGNGTIGAWKEESKPSLSSLEKIAVKTGIPVEEWLRDGNFSEVKARDKC